MGLFIKEGSYFLKVYEEEGQSILVEELIGEEDMEVVFKLRLKIKVSLILSLMREWDDDQEWESYGQYLIYCRIRNIKLERCEVDK